MPDPHLAEAEFKRRFIAQFQDPAFDPLAPELEKLAAAAWDGYAHASTHEELDVGGAVQEEVRNAARGPA